MIVNIKVKKWGKEKIKLQEYKLWRWMLIICREKQINKGTHNNLEHSNKQGINNYAYQAEWNKFKGKVTIINVKYEQQRNKISTYCNYKQATQE